AINVATLKLEVEINRLDQETFDTQKPVYDEALKAYKAAFANLDKVVELPSINEDMADAVQAVRNLDQLSASSLEGLESGFANLMQDAESVFSTTSSITLLGLYSQSFQESGDNSKTGIINYHVSTFQTTLSDLQEIMSTVSKTIELKINAI